MTRVTSRSYRPHELEQLLRKEPPRPLYSCLGEESYLSAQAIDLLRAATVGPDDAFNFHRFDAGPGVVNDVVAAASTLPAFASWRMVVLTRTEAVPAAEQDVLLGYLESPSPTTCLVLTAAKADQRRKLFSSLLERAVQINCQPLFERELPAWVAGQASAMGLTLTADTAHALVEQTGASLHALLNELEKLRAHAQSGQAPGTITPDALAELTAHGRTHSVFELTDAAGERRLADALIAVHRLLVNGEQPVGLVALLTRHLRRLLLVRCALDAGAPASSLAQQLGVMPRYADTLARQANRFTAAELRRTLERCLIADSRLKGGRMADEQVLDWLLIEICRAEAWQATPV